MSSPPTLHLLTPALRRRPHCSATLLRRLPWKWIRRERRCYNPFNQPAATGTKPAHAAVEKSRWSKPLGGRNINILRLLFLSHGSDPTCCGLINIQLKFLLRLILIKSVIQVFSLNFCQLWLCECEEATWCWGEKAVTGMTADCVPTFKLDPTTFTLYI